MRHKKIDHGAVTSPSNLTDIGHHETLEERSRSSNPSE